MFLKKIMQKLRDNDQCYVCGRDNPAGLRVDFEIDRNAGSIRGTFTPEASHQGFEGIVHGGILSALLDEAMAKLAFSLGINAVTAEMTVKFRSPAAPGDRLLITGRLTEESRRLIEAESKIETGAVVVAEAKGKLLRVE